jgi:hypothetical protein
MTDNKEPTALEMLRVVCNCLVDAGKIELGTIESASLFKAAGALGAFDEAVTERIVNKSASLEVEYEKDA